MQISGTARNLHALCVQISQLQERGMQAYYELACTRYMVMVRMYENGSASAVCNYDQNGQYVDTALSAEPAFVGRGAGLRRGTPASGWRFAWWHGSTHFVRPSVRGTLQAIADSYAERYPDNADDERPADQALKPGQEERVYGNDVTYNDCSLMWGGVLDIRGAWATDYHKSHRVGGEVDIPLGSLPIGPTRNYLWSLLQRYNGRHIEEGSTTHWHFRFP